MGPPCCFSNIRRRQRRTNKRTGLSYLLTKTREKCIRKRESKNNLTYLAFFEFFIFYFFSSNSLRFLFWMFFIYLRRMRHRDQKGPLVMDGSRGSITIHHLVSTARTWNYGASPKCALTYTAYVAAVITSYSSCLVQWKCTETKRPTRCSSRDRSALASQ